MMATLDFKTSSGEIHSIEYQQYVMNDKQQFAVLAVDREDLPIEIEDVEGIQYAFLGKLEEQSFIWKAQIENSLMRDHWDFEENPNPEILLITRK